MKASGKEKFEKNGIEEIEDQMDKRMEDKWTEKPSYLIHYPEYEGITSRVTRLYYLSKIFRERLEVSGGKGLNGFLEGGWCDMTLSRHVYYI